ncbi:MAG: SdpI family protein [Actinomycetota bacterium]|nr:SdpI family protein [Actinomycetota bacterium]
MRASMVLGVLLLVAGAGLLTVGLLGWRRLLPRNRFAGIRTPATLRSDAAFIAANRVAAPPVLAAGAVCIAGGGLALGSGGPALPVIVAVAGAGSVGLSLAGGLLGHRVAVAIPPPPAGGCAGCACGGTGCTTT